jgi:hypothetical protein
MSPLVPYTEKGRNFSDLSESESGPERENLLYAFNDEIRLHHDGENKEYLIRKENMQISELAFQKGRVVCLGQGTKIFSLETRETLAQGALCITALAVEDDKIVVAQADFSGDKPRHRIVYAETGELITERSKEISALAIHDGRLIDAGDYRSIFRTKTNLIIARPRHSVNALAARGNELDYSEYYSIGYEIHSAINEAPSNRLIQLRKGRIRSLAIYNGRLIDAGDYGSIRYSETSEDPIVEIGAWISSLLPINQEITDRLLTLKGVRRI